MSDGAQPYSARPSAYRNPGERIPAWTCACPVSAWQRHVLPWQCLGEDIVLAHWLAYPKTTYRVVRMLAWLEDSFAR